MAAGMPLSPGGKHDFILPVPPPLLHTRSGNETYDGPRTPIQQGFTSPTQTPQGSPSKNRMPPGANDLPNVFDNAMKLTPTTFSSPVKGGRQAQTSTSPSKSAKSIAEDEANGAEDGMARRDYGAMPGSPTRKSNKENTPPGFKAAKESNFTQNQAAASRQELYQPREQLEPPPRRGYTPQRGLTAEEIEKLQKPQVKRLANVTQLCKIQSPLLYQYIGTDLQSRLPRLLFRLA